ncbi:MAG: hypothetical protein KH437_10830 [Prevotella sp.]|nr:hypothetical protein [Prevotella sp.]
MIYAVIDTNILVSSRISKNPLAATVKVVANVFQNRIIPVFNEEILSEWRKRSIPTHSEWLYPLTFDAGKGLKEA